MMHPPLKKHASQVCSPAQRERGLVSKPEPSTFYLLPSSALLLSFCCRSPQNVTYELGKYNRTVMISLRLSLLSVGACLLPGAEAFGLLQSRGLILQTTHRSPSRSFAPKGCSAIGQRCSVAMQVNPREDADFEMTVDWDEELRKLNASEYGKRRADRDLTKDIDDPEALKWAKSNAKQAQSAVQETSYKVRGAMQKAPRWQQVSRDYRFWLGLVVALSLLSSILSASGRTQDLVVWNDTLGQGDEAAEAFAYATLLAATTAHAAGDAASQLAETGASMVFV